MAGNLDRPRVRAGFLLPFTKHAGASVRGATSRSRVKQRGPLVPAAFQYLEFAESKAIRTDLLRRLLSHAKPYVTVLFEWLLFESKLLVCSLLSRISRWQGLMELLVNWSRFPCFAIVGVRQWRVRGVFKTYGDSWNFAGCLRSIFVILLPCVIFPTADHRRTFMPLAKK